MTSWEKISKKIITRQAAARWSRACQQNGKLVVFTNGCFDLLHFGHLKYLAAARDLGDHLIIGLNSRESVARLKGPHRPIQDDATRQSQLAALEFVDQVVWFAEDTPLKLIEAVCPNILVKGGDYVPDTVVGADFVCSQGGRVEILAFEPGYSTSKIEERIRAW